MDIREVKAYQTEDGQMFPSLVLATQHGEEILKKKAKDAFNTILDYCNEKSSCDDCPFYNGTCFFRNYENLAPDQWEKIED